MESLSVAEAATLLGITTNTIYTCIQRGELVKVTGPGPVQVAAASVRTVQLTRSREAAGRVPGGVVRFAGMVAHKIRPPALPTVVLADGRREVVSGIPGQPPTPVSRLPRAAAAIWGRSVLTAAAVSGACRWCVARSHAAVTGELPPRDDAPTRVLLASAPCVRDRQSWAAESDAERARIRRQLAEMAAARQQQDSAAVQRAEAALTAARTRAGRSSALAASAAKARPGGVAERVLEMVTREGGVTAIQVRYAFSFPPGQAKQLLDAMVGQRLVRRRDGDGRYVRVTR